MENSTEIINQGRPVYFSYARNSKKKPEWEHISDSVETLLETMTANNLEYRVDVRDIGTGDKISKFEQEIGWNSEVVVIIFSDKYFRSMHCMYEFVQIKNALKQYPDKRLMCIKSGDFNLADINYIMELEDYWKNQKNEYEKIEYHRLRNHSGTEKAAWQNEFYLEDIRNLYSFFSEINYSNAANINYENFVGDIVKYYKTTPKPELTPKPAKNSSQPQPPTRTDTTQTRIAQPPTHAVHTPTQTAPTPTYIAQPQPQPQSVQTVVQQTTSTSQSSTKQLPIKQIAIAAAVVLAIVIYAVTGESKSEILERAQGLFDAGKYSEAVVDYEKLATKGDAEAQNGLGRCHAVAQNYGKAVEWFQKAAEQGYPGAQLNLGTCYYYGQGVAQNYEKAVEWYKKAGEQGLREAQCNLGYCYLYGNGVSKNISQAKYWFQKAAVQGDELAIEALKAL